MLGLQGLQQTPANAQDSDLALFVGDGAKVKKKLMRLSHLVSSAGISRSSRMANDAIAADKIPITEPTPAVHSIYIRTVSL